MANWLRLHRIDFSVFRVAFQSNDSRDTLGIVNLGNEINNLASTVSNGTGQIIDIVERTIIRLSLARNDRAS
jgi:hypothetical protein